ncbi:MAG: multiheme c-type cytochrome [Candidatus Poribacteria bacterium]|nr:multiheme c-type cytochrome [Candidatus Poribacteria bacterium]
MSFKSVFIAVFLGTSLIVIALIFNANRPTTDTSQPSSDFVRATGKCATCHRRETSAVVHQFERSEHAKHGVSCLDCHHAVDGQEQQAHRGFTIAKHLTSKNCSECHSTEYTQFLRSRHAAPAWAAVSGARDFTAEQIAFAEKYHKGAVNRPANPLALAEGESAINVGCLGCHDIGKPNTDGSIGTCTACHARHSTSIALAREPETCGQCHMGPDHSQIEIYHESKHGVLYNAQKADMNLKAPPKKLTTADMSVPTCVTCHLSGLDGLNVTHDTTERLSYWLFAAVSDKRPTYQQGQDAMKETCLKCHARSQVEKFYQEAEGVVADTNEKINEAVALMKSLREDGILTDTPFDEPIEFLYFDLWHYYGRTAKHGAFMGGADFVQWHGNYELLLKMTEMKKIDRELRRNPKNP